ncbi:hypothetical protein FRC01_014866, partial [Tulasnella sp. 417]
VFVQGIALLDLVFSLVAHCLSSSHFETMLMPSDVAALEEAIVSACDEHERKHWNDRDYRRCLVFRGFFIKFDGYASLLPQMETQRHVSEFAKRTGSAVRVPEVIHFFHQDGRMAYVVMEYIELIPTPDLELAQKAALAVQWLRDVPAPSDRVYIGPLGNGRARHVLFKNYEAPLAFSSIQALERYLNKVVAIIRRRLPAVEDVSIRHERLVGTQSDMHITNFGADAEGRPCLLDFGDIGWLPESFASYTTSSANGFVAAVAEYLDWPSSLNLATMAR